jgi:hypothetical protein
MISERNRLTGNKIIAMQGHYSTVHYSNRLLLGCWHQEALGEHARSDNVYLTLPPHTYRTDTSHVEAGLITLTLLNMITWKDIIYHPLDDNQAWWQRTKLTAIELTTRRSLYKNRLFLTADCAVDRVTYGNLRANISDALFEVLEYSRITCAMYLVLEAAVCPMTVSVIWKQISDDVRSLILR